MASIDQAEFKNSYLNLGERFSTPQKPTPVPEPHLIRLNANLANFLGLDARELNTLEAIQCLAGNRIPANSQPLAAVYAGHQFGQWNPQLGDGRAILLGELQGQDQNLYDVQLKGGGQTPYSRMGDGRSPLGPVLREYVVSETMAALGIATTRALAAVASGERVVRDQLLPGAVLTRVAQSHIRIGTFQYFSARQDIKAIQQLADYVIHRHYRDYVNEFYPDDPYTGLLAAVVNAQARLVAQWMSVGFIHGVMNTDNMLLSGETIDYGPCAFMDRYNPRQVYSSIDRQGRYAYSNQPDIARWNLSWLAQALLPLMDKTELGAVKKAEKQLEQFVTLYDDYYQTFFARKLGFDKATEKTVEVCEAWLSLLASEDCDFTLSFRALADQLGAGEEVVENIYPLPEKFQPWLQHWRALLTEQGISSSQARQTLLKSNPLFIPRNHVLEAAINMATYNEDFTLFHQLVDALANPYDYQPEYLQLAQPPGPGQEIVATFCGT
ncbi:protein adenylyltransferase SelO [Halioxenophilus sp. WMMB6]|uniref:protein adenylyltransferase SelO n=1 Tax=Halioxenophilus sp. WMMB6 TaxID=3073815 RepID=UPI00295E86A5|nr:YdiU family protein [Halioxenophilus sp. WMMB6]